MSIDTFSVVIAACKATASVGFLSFLGIILAWQKVLDQSGLKIISRVTQLLLIPSLTFVSISGSMSMAYFKTHWGLIVAGVASIALGAFIGRLMLSVSRATPSFRPWFVLACTFPNVFAIPLVFIEAICRGENETLSMAEECIAHASTRLFTMIMFFPLLVYGFGAVYAKQSLANLPRCETMVTTSVNCVSSTTSESVKDDIAAGSPAVNADELESQLEQVEQEENGPSAQSVKEDDIAITGITTQKSPPTASVGSCYWQLRVILLENPPVMATLVAVVVALLEPVQKILYGPDAPLQFVTNALSVLGKAVPCLTNITMAASLGCQLMKLERFSDILGGPKAGISRWTLFVLVATKMLLIPSIYFLILIQVHDLLPEDRWYRLLLFIEAETPTANNVVLLANVLGESESAQILALTSVTQLVFFLPISTVFTAAGLAMTDKLRTTGLGGENNTIDWILSSNLTNITTASLYNMTNASGA